MEKRNRYRNRIRPLTIARLVLGGVLLMATGVGFVLVRNDHVMTGNEIRELEDLVVDFDREIEMWEVRIASVRAREELSRRLRWVQSDLAEIETSRVIDVSPDDVDAESLADVFSWDR